MLRDSLKYNNITSKWISVDARDYMTCGVTTSGNTWWSDSSYGSTYKLIEKYSPGSTNALRLKVVKLDDVHYIIEILFNIVFNEWIPFYNDSGFLISIDLLKILNEYIDSNILTIKSAAYSSIYLDTFSGLTFSSNNDYNPTTDRIDVIAMSRCYNNKIIIGTNERSFYTTDPKIQAIIAQGNLGIIEVEKKLLNLNNTNINIPQNYYKGGIFMLRNKGLNIIELNNIKANIDHKHVQTDITDRTYIFQDRIRNYNTVKSIKIPKYTDFCIIRFSDHTTLSNQIAIINLVYFGETPPRSNVALKASAFFHSPLTDVGLATNVSPRVSMSGMLIYDGEDNNYAYYHTQGSDYDDILYITAEKKVSKPIFKSHSQRMVA